MHSRSLFDVVVVFGEEQKHNVKTNLDFFLPLWFVGNSRHNMIIHLIQYKLMVNKLLTVFNIWICIIFEIMYRKNTIER